MKTLALVAVFTLALAGCEKPGDSGRDSGGNSGQDQDEVRESVYKCKSEQVPSRVSVCIKDGMKSKAMAADIATWTVPIGDWLSLLFKTKHFQNKYKPTDVETSCLIEQFCKEKVP